MEFRAPADIWPHLFQSSRDKESTVRDLLDRVAVLPLGAFPMEHNLIVNFRLQDFANEDVRRWRLSSNGVFTVKFFYHFLNDGGLSCKWTPVILKGCCPKKINFFN